MWKGPRMYALFPRSWTFCSPYSRRESESDTYWRINMNGNSNVHGARPIERFIQSEKPHITRIATNMFGYGWNEAHSTERVNGKFIYPPKATAINPYKYPCVPLHACVSNCVCRDWIFDLRRTEGEYDVRFSQWISMSHSHFVCMQIKNVGCWSVKLPCARLRIHTGIWLRARVVCDGCLWQIKWSDDDDMLRLFLWRCPNPIEYRFPRCLFLFGLDRVNLFESN